MTLNDIKVLEQLALHHHSEFNCITFDNIAVNTGLDRKHVRVSCRRLARKGLAQYMRGLFNDDGMVAGSGYCCTDAGYRMLEEQLNEV